MVRARADLVRATFSEGTLPAELAAKVQAVANAERAVAMAVGETFPRIKAEMKLAPAREAAVFELVTGVRPGN